MYTLQQEVEVAYALTLAEDEVKLRTQRPRQPVLMSHPLYAVRRV